MPWILSNYHWYVVLFSCCIQHKKCKNYYLTITFFFFQLLIALTLHVAAADNGLGTLESLHVDLIDQFYLEDSDRVDKTYNKRESIGASLNRHHTHVNRKPYNERLGRLKARPFSRYGPPRTSVSAIAFKSPRLNEHPNSGSHQQPSRKHPYDDSAQPEKIQMLGVPSPIRQVDFRDQDPIASQNNEPFQHNVANYLPPKNQQLPGSTSFHMFQLQQPTHQLDNERHNTNRDAVDQSQISDATEFLLKNSEALSKLYQAPVMNLNYPPFEGAHSLNEQVQKSGSLLDHSGWLTHAPDYPQSNPSYASGSSNVPTMNTFHAQEPRKIMKHFPTSGALRNAPKNRLPSNKRNKNCGDNHTFKTIKVASSDDWNSRTTDPNNASPTDVSVPSAESISTAASTIPPSHVLDLRPQGNTPYPQYSRVLPLFATSFNLPNHIPSYQIALGGSSIYTGAYKNSLPTHFGLPLPTIPSGRENASPSSAGAFSPIQPVFSIIPTGTSIQSPFSAYPAYGIPPVPIHSGLPT